MVTVLAKVFLWAKFPRRFAQCVELPGGSVKSPPASAGAKGYTGSPWVGKIPWRRKWLPIPVSVPGESDGQRTLAGYSPGGHKESDRTE